MKFIKNNLLFIIVDVSSSTEAFVEKVGLIAVRRGVLRTLPHLQQPIRPETERRTAIRQTVPTKASDEAETSTIINKWLFFNEFHFEIVYRSTYEYIQRTITIFLPLSFPPHLPSYRTLNAR